MTIVLLDDNEMDLFVSSKLLENLHADVTVKGFTNPDNALDFLQADNSVIGLFVDNQMPGMSGFDFLAMLIENDIILPYMAVLTASLGTAERSKYAQLSRKVHLFEKPIKPDQIRLSLSL